MEIKEIHTDESSSIELSRGMKGTYSYSIKIKTFGIESNNKAIKKLQELKQKVDSFIIGQGGIR